MRTPTDALRSMARYVALALGDEWEVRMTSERGVFRRPFARVVQVPSIGVTAEHWSRSLYIASYQVVAFPPEPTSVDLAQAESLDVADTLLQAFVGTAMVGNPTVRPPVDSTRSRSARVPLYDYDGIPFEGAAAFAGEDARDPRDFLKVEGDPEAQVTPAAGEELLFTVTLNIRMSWVRNAAVPSAKPTTSSVRLEPSTP